MATTPKTSNKKKPQVGRDPNIIKTDSSGRKSRVRFGVHANVFLRRGFLLGKNGQTDWPISSPPGWRDRIACTNGNLSTADHGGYDVACPEGTMVLAPWDGVVYSKTQRNQNTGKVIGAGLYISFKPEKMKIKIKENGKVKEIEDTFHVKDKPNEVIWLLFMHLTKVAVPNGTRVKRGTIIGYTGGKDGDPNAGNSSGEHCHFQAQINNDFKNVIDPASFITDDWYYKLNNNFKYTSKVESVPKLVPIKSSSAAPEDDEIDTATPNYNAENADDRAEDVNLTQWSASETSEENQHQLENQPYYTEEYTFDESDEDKDTVRYQEAQRGFAPGIWQIMKIAIDESVKYLRLRDASTSLQQGSLINFFKKVCQEPLVEFFGDTYGDQYYFIARKPPFDEETMLKTLTAQGIYDLETGDESVEDTIYDIYEKDIVNANISFNNQDIYSWYQYTPVYELATADSLKFIIPAVLFPEYAAMWGSKSMNIQSQYRDFRDPQMIEDIKSGNKSFDVDLEVKATIHEMKYLIETTAYNPFVRRGMINILGTRKIKRGVFVRVHWNGLSSSEIFYVDSVQQNYNVSAAGVNRLTSLTLSHGMLTKFINTKNLSYVDENQNSQPISYFNLIDFDNYTKDLKNIDMDKWRDIISNWKVNKDVFMFFLRKQQFFESIKSFRNNE